MKQLTKSFATVLGTALFLSGCSEVTFPAPKTPVIEVQKVPELKTSRIQSYPAVIQASDLTTLSFQLNGEIVQLIATEGMRVKKGDLLAKLDDTTYKLSVSEAKAKVELSKVRAQRAKAMVEQGNMAKSTFDELNAQYEQATAALKYAKIQLDYVELHAPFDGIISTVHVENYQATNIGSPAISMHKREMVEVVATLPDSLVAAIDRDNVEARNMQIPVKLDAYPDDNFIGHYKEHTAQPSDENRNFILTLEMPFNPEKPALQGMPGSITLDLASLERKQISHSVVPMEALLLPDSLTSEQPKRIVWRANGNKVEPVKVLVTRLSALGTVEVKGDIRPGDLVVTKGLQYLEPNMEVTIKNSGETL
ncbi:efflux RND transporter periplasmic adaptor subunit [Thalassotalea euphylliae]|uniref:efflux RND transporter periplasmic adaptor subunit n=1 Tax=Thalassotalea euphylliae TaxID=1655234 RepID=UPI00363AF675